MSNIYLPKVSIIIPVYNGSNFLKEAIDSALAQTYNNLEIIVVNDGSKDDGATEEIAKSYGNRIRYFKKENGGVATALNLGIEKMAGEYFSWLSHDDLYYQDKIEKQIDFLNKLDNKKVVLYSNYSVLIGDKITPVKHNHEMLLRKNKYSLLRGCVNGITMLVPKSILDEVGEFDSSLRCTQDYDLWRRIQKKYEFIHMQNVLSITRLHQAQDSVSERAVIEGDVLWIDMIKKLSIKEKIQYEGTLYNFYCEMVKFLEATPYKATLEYCKKEFEALENEYAIQAIPNKVSVIIPFYNRPNQTIIALKSVLSQSYENIEIILVNDGSSNDISKLIKFIKKYNTVKLIDMKKNSGPAAARNEGMRHSTGDYIAFLDSDDEFLDEKIKKQLFMMLKHNPNVSYTSYFRRDGGNETIEVDQELTGIIVPRIINNCTIATPTIMIRKKFLEEHSILFNENIRVGEDTCFWYEVAKYSEFLLINEPLTIVNVDSGSHARDANKLIIGIKNIITYLLNDSYYSKFNDNISILCNYFFEIDNNIQQKELEYLLYGGPVASARPVEPGPVLSRKDKIKSYIKDGIMYRVLRKLYSDGLLVTTKTVIDRMMIK